MGSNKADLMHRSYRNRQFAASAVPGQDAQDLLSDAYRSLLLQLVAVQLISGCAKLLLQLQVLAHMLCSSLKVPRCQCSPACATSSSERSLVS